MPARQQRARVGRWRRGRNSSSGRAAGGEARRGEARRGEARRGEARRGEARRGQARHGEDRRLLRGSTARYSASRLLLSRSGLDRPRLRGFLERARAALDDGAGVLGVEDVTHVDRDAVLDARHHRRRMKHLCAKESQLNRLVVLKRLYREGLWHAAGVRSVDAVHVLPHRDLGRLHHPREDGCRVV